MEVTQQLDARGLICPTNFVRAKLKLETMSSGDILELMIDGSGSLHNVPKALLLDGHQILEIKEEHPHYRVFVKKA